MKKILAIVGRDFKSGTRDSLIIYLSIAPILLALLLKAMIPSLSSSTINIGMVTGADPRLISYLQTYVKVQELPTRVALEERIQRMDDFFGVAGEGSAFEIIKQGNENEGQETILRSVLNQYGGQTVKLPIDVVFSDLSWEMSPLKQFGGALLVIFTTVFGGMLILLNLVEEKMSNTLSAMNVASITKAELVVGKGLLGFILPIFGALSATLILGFGAINYGMLLVSIISIAMISVIIGFSIGVVNDEPIAAVASMKMVFVPILASVMGAIFLAKKWHVLFYWSPFYWAYDSINSVLLNQATWGQIIRNGSIILVITMLVFMALKNRIKAGLN
ncbi:MAG: ABC transporter permease [bacterium]|nr:ABC transporter permease [bacterium]